MAELISVYRKDTGEKVLVPDHWMDHPTLSLPFRKTPSQKARELEQEEKAAAEAHAAALENLQVLDPSQPDAGDQPVDDKKE